MTNRVFVRYGAGVALILVVWAGPATAQSPDPQGAGSQSVAFMPRTLFHMTAEHLSSDDPRFVWDANFGGELDVVDYGYGRFTFEGNYQVVLGREMRTFDPNQGNYVLTGLISIRARGTEIAGELYHQSRHLADREKDQAVAWNMLGIRARRRITRGNATVDTHADFRGVLVKAFVDYSWELDAGARSDVQLRPNIGLLLAGGVRTLGVDGTRSRGTQAGYRVEGGVRFEGRGGAIELFVADERRIDPSPLEQGTDHWVTAGFRLLSRESGR